MSTTYEAYCKYIMKIKNQAKLCQLSDLDTVNYAKSRFAYIEQNLWIDYYQQLDTVISWKEFQTWLLLQLDNSKN